MKIELPPSSFITICFVLFMSAIYFLSGISQRQLIKKQSCEKALKVERPKPSTSYSVLIIQMTLIISFLISYNEGWTFASVGLKFEIAPIISLIVGHIFYVLFLFALTKILNILKLIEGFHFAGDIYPFLFLKTNAINYRNRRRNKRVSRDFN